MKIGYFQTSYFPRLGGVPARTRNMAMIMNHHEHVVFVRQYYKTGRSFAKIEPGIVDYGYCKVHYFQQPLDKDDPNFITSTYTHEMIQTIKKSDIDVLIVNGYDANYHYLIENCGKPVILRHSIQNTELPPNVMKHVSDIVTYIKSPVKSVVIPPFIDYDVFKDDSEGEKIVLYTGRISHEKGLDRLMPLLGRRKLLIIGEPDHPEHLEQFQALANRYSVNYEIVPSIFHDLVEYNKQINRAKYFVLASPKETYSQSLLEALACNRVCIALETKGIEWAKGQYYNLKTLDNIENLERKNTREWVIKNYNKELLINKWQNVFKNIRYW